MHPLIQQRWVLQGELAQRFKQWLEEPEQQKLCAKIDAVTRAILAKKTEHQPPKGAA